MPNITGEVGVNYGCGLIGRTGEAFTTGPFRSGTIVNGILGGGVISPSTMIGFDASQVSLVYMTNGNNHPLSLALNYIIKC